MSSTFTSKYRSAGEFWCSRREASLNWLALGLLLAAWNASDNNAQCSTAKPLFCKQIFSAESRIRNTKSRS
jgi:hypothetical protein